MSDVRSVLSCSHDFGEDGASARQGAFRAPAEARRQVLPATVGQRSRSRGPQAMPARSTQGQHVLQLSGGGQVDQALARTAHQKFGHATASGQPSAVIPRRSLIVYILIYLYF